MKIILLGAAHIGRALVDALHEEHEMTVIDIDADRLAALSSRYDVRTVEGDGTTEQVSRKAGVKEADLFIGCSPREEANLVGAMLVKRLSGAQTIVRTTSTAYLDAWRERHLDVDFMVSPELETANAISTTLGLPAARHTDIFADGKVQIVEFDVAPHAPQSDPVYDGTVRVVEFDGAPHAPQNKLVGRNLRSAEMPPASKVPTIIR